MQELLLFFCWKKGTEGIFRDVRVDAAHLVQVLVEGMLQHSDVQGRKKGAGNVGVAESNTNAVDRTDPENVVNHIIWIEMEFFLHSGIFRGADHPVLLQDRARLLPDRCDVGGEAVVSFLTDVLSHHGLLRVDKTAFAGSSCDVILIDQRREGFVDRHPADIVLITQFFFYGKLVTRMQTSALDLINDVLCDREIECCFFQFVLLFIKYIQILSCH